MARKLMCGFIHEFIKVMKVEMHIFYVIIFIVMLHRIMWQRRLFINVMMVLFLLHDHCAFCGVKRQVMTRGGKKQLVLLDENGSDGDEVDK
mmetsp:Transcript_3821/g.5080  ORF Transcript_3821/g.5080 Transcript_3821/m.5080 type:complete len:91 (-) Transcript_3821:32-304(-)